MAGGRLQRSDQHDRTGPRLQPRCPVRLPSTIRSQRSASSPSDFERWSAARRKRSRQWSRDVMARGAIGFGAGRAHRRHARARHLYRHPHRPCLRQGIGTGARMSGHRDRYLTGDRSQCRAVHGFARRGRPRPGKAQILFGLYRRSRQAHLGAACAAQLFEDAGEFPTVRTGWRSCGGAKTAPDRCGHSARTSRPPANATCRSLRKFARLVIDAICRSMPLRPLYLAESYAKPRSARERRYRSSPRAMMRRVLAALHARLFRRKPGVRPIWPSYLPCRGVRCIDRAVRRMSALGFPAPARAPEMKPRSSPSAPARRRAARHWPKTDRKRSRTSRQRKITRLLIEVRRIERRRLALYRKFGFASVGLPNATITAADGRRRMRSIMRKEISA